MDAVNSRVWDKQFDFLCDLIKRGREERLQAVIFKTTARQVRNFLALGAQA